MPIDLFAPRGRHGNKPTLADRIEVVGDCWLWQGTISQKGYAALWWDGKMRVAHRVIWEGLVGPIPEGLTLDHLCRVHNCVNPDHLEPVTNAENTRRGWRKNRWQCRNGHELTPENVYIWRGARICRTCSKQALDEFHERRQISA